VFGDRNAGGVADKIDIVEVDDIFGYDKLVAAEKATLQKGMNYRVGKGYSVFLMSIFTGKHSGKSGLELSLITPRMFLLPSAMHDRIFSL
jgi:hypothetical protein